MDFPARTLTEPKTFVIEVGTDGFNAFLVLPDGSRDLFAASSSMSTFLKVMEQIANAHGGEVRFGIDLFTEKRYTPSV